MSFERRDHWAKHHGLKRDPPFAEYDAIEAAIVRVLADTTTKRRAPAAFKQLQASFREAVLSGATEFWAVVPRRGNDFVFARSPHEAISAAESISESVWIVRFDAAIDTARRRYKRYRSAGAVALGEVQELRKGRRGLSRS